MAPSVLVASFEDLADPRVERTRVHGLDEVLVVAVLAVLAGADDWDESVEWAEARRASPESFAPAITPPVARRPLRCESRSPFNRPDDANHPLSGLGRCG